MNEMDLSTVDHLLTTTRAVRRRLDLERRVEPEIVKRCVELALQAPTGGNLQGWHFVVVEDAGKRSQLAELYRQAAETIVQGYRAGLKGDAREQQLVRMLAQHDEYVAKLPEIPLFVVPCVEGRSEGASVFIQASFYGSILPAVWSFMLALRARGLGTVWTTDHLMYEREAAEILGIPENVTQVALIPVAYFTGADFKPARRFPADSRIHWETWGRRRATAKASPPAPGVSIVDLLTVRPGHP